jgi:hypothetical protein
LISPWVVTALNEGAFSPIRGMETDSFAVVVSIGYLLVSISDKRV